MARRRMFSLEIVSSDRFLSLPPTAQSFYFHLGVHADDEGFVSAPTSLGLLCKATDRDLRALLDAGYVIRFDSGVLVIVDWMLHNTIRKDRSMETIHRVEKQLVHLVDGRYVLQTEQSEQAQTTNLATNLTTENDIFFSDESAPQNRIENNRTDYSNQDQSNADDLLADMDYDEMVRIITEGQERERERKKHISSESISYAPSYDQVHEYFQAKGITYVSAEEFWNYYNRKKWLDQNGQPITNWQAMALRWNDRNREK